MKIEQKSGFKPVVITIETEEELCDLWHRYNVSENVVNNHSAQLLKHKAVYCYTSNNFDKINRILENNNLYK